MEEPWPAERHGQAGEAAGHPWEQGSRAGEMTAMGGACYCREGEGGRRGEEGSRAGGLPFKEALAAAIGGQGRQLQSSAHVSLLAGDGMTTLNV